MRILRSQQAGLLSRHKINMMLSQVLHVCTAGNWCHSKCGDVLGSPAGIAFVFRMFKCSVLILPHWTQWTLFPVKIRQNFMYRAFYLPLLLNNRVRSENLISRTEGPQCLGQCCRDPLGRVLGSSRGSQRSHTSSSTHKKGDITKYFLLEQASWYKQKKKKRSLYSEAWCYANCSLKILKQVWHPVARISMGITYPFKPWACSLRKLSCSWGHIFLSGVGTTVLWVSSLEESS